MCVSAFLGIMAGHAISARADDDDSASRRATAHAQFARAESLRTALEAKSEHDRVVQDYKAVVSAYRRVYLITPRAAEVPPALNEVGVLYTTMGARFEHSYYDSAVESYEFLLHEYPTSRYREDALLAIAAIQRNGLAQTNLAQKTYEDFLWRYPHSTRAEEARRAIAEMEADDKLSTPDPSLPSAAASGMAAGANPGGPSSEVGPVHVWNADTYTRIVIDLGGQAKYQTARIYDPDRIYFDIDSAKLSRELLKGAIEVPSGGYLKTVRVAQNRSTVVRVVLEVTKIKDYSVFELSNPDRLVVDVYGPNATGPNPISADASVTTPPTVADATRAGNAAKTGKTTSPATSAAVFGPPAPNGQKSNARKGDDAKPSDRASITDGDEGAPADVKPFRTKSIPSNTAPTVSARDSSDATAGLVPVSAKAEAAAIGPPTVPARTHNGEHSLTRALGLKIGRIVIDAGHGGHDTGTIGPTGLMEKDLCLDVALRLGKLIQDRLAATEVIYTRDDDSFVPLEQRTAIANNAHADLFLSIHANSSDDKRVGGIETYYLNFNASPEAMEVASRENALAQGSVHDLQDFVKKIARNEKIEESRDLATDVQDSLAKRIGRAEPDRGVRKAPFVVLLGADMPSVLAETSFLSNPSDEQWLKKPENRQSVAEGLYHGIESYLQSTNSLSLNPAYTPVHSAAASSGPVAHSTEPQ